MITKIDHFLYLHRDRLWRFHTWMLAWLCLLDTMVQLATFTYYSPRWWGKAFDYYLDRGWL